MHECLSVTLVHIVLDLVYFGIQLAACFDMLLFVYTLFLPVVIMISSKGPYDLVQFSVLPQARGVNDEYTIPRPGESSTDAYCLISGPFLNLS